MDRRRVVEPGEDLWLYSKAGEEQAVAELVTFTLEEEPAVDFRRKPRAGAEPLAVQPSGSSLGAELEAEQQVLLTVVEVLEEVACQFRRAVAAGVVAPTRPPTPPGEAQAGGSPPATETPPVVGPAGA